MVKQIHNPSSLRSWEEAQSHFKPYDRLTCVLIDSEGSIGLTDESLNSDVYVCAYNDKITNKTRARMVIAARVAECALQSDDEFFAYANERDLKEIESDRIYFDRLNALSKSLAVEPVTVVASTIRQFEVEELIKASGLSLIQLIAQSAMYDGPVCNAALHLYDKLPLRQY